MDTVAHSVDGNEEEDLDYGQGSKRTVKSGMRPSRNGTG